MTDTYIPVITPRVDVTDKATLVARIFNILAVVILVLGGLGVTVALLGSVAAAVNGGSLFPFIAGIFYALFIAAYTALLWAGVALGTVVAGYIANRTE